MSETNFENDRYATPLPFGWLEDGEVKVLKLGPDSDGSAHRWFKFTKETISLEGLRVISESRSEYRGFCYDTGEYSSPAADMVYDLLSNPPEGSVVATCTNQGWCGTRTFETTVSVSFYGN